MQPELLLYKARYLYELGETDNAKNCFNAGYYLMACQDSREEADESAREILGERLARLNPQAYHTEYLKEA